MDIISFNLDHLGIFASENAPNFLNDYKNDFVLDEISRNERRRLTNCAKTMFSLSCGFDLSTMPLSFSSNKGEINSCILMLQELSREKVVSPTNFSNSVLNSSLSKLCIHHKNHSDISTISSKYLKDLFINAYVRLQNDSKVGIFYYHENLNEIFNNEEIFVCLFAIVSNGNNIKIDLEYKDDNIFNQFKNIINNDWDKL